MSSDRYRQALACDPSFCEQLTAKVLSDYLKGAKLSDYAGHLSSGQLANAGE